MAEVERKSFIQAIKDDFNPRLWRRRTKFSLGLAAILIVFMLISALRASTGEVPQPVLIIESILEGRYEEALVALDSLEALYEEEALDPDIAWIEGQRGFVRLQQGRYTEGVDLLDRAISLDPTRANYFSWRADANRALGRNDAALFDLDTLVDLTPGDWRPYITRAEVKNSLGDVEGAISDLDTALGLGPTPEGLEEIDLTRAAILGGTAN